MEENKILLEQITKNIKDNKLKYSLLKEKQETLKRYIYNKAEIKSMNFMAHINNILVNNFKALFLEMYKDSILKIFSKYRGLRMKGNRKSLFEKEIMRLTQCNVALYNTNLELIYKSKTGVVFTLSLNPKNKSNKFIDEKFILKEVDDLIDMNMKTYIKDYMTFVEDHINKKDQILQDLEELKNKIDTYNNLSGELFHEIINLEYKIYDGFYFDNTCYR